MLVSGHGVSLPAVESAHAWEVLLGKLWHRRIRPESGIEACYSVADVQGCMWPTCSLEDSKSCATLFFGTCMTHEICKREVHRPCPKQIHPLQKLGSNICTWVSNSQCATSGPETNSKRPWCWLGTKVCKVKLDWPFLPLGSNYALQALRCQHRKRQHDRNIHSPLCKGRKHGIQLMSMGLQIRRRPFLRFLRYSYHDQSSKGSCESSHSGLSHGRDNEETHSNISEAASAWGCNWDSFLRE